MRKRLKGSISIFLAFVLICVVAVLFVLLELARVHALEQRTEIDSVITANSMMANYNRILWDEYGLLLMDGDCGETSLQIEMLAERGLEYAVENMDIRAGEEGVISRESWNLLGLRPTALKVSAYGLATDQEGYIFLLQAAKQMEHQFSENMLEMLYEMVTRDENFDDPPVTVTESTGELVLAENPIEVADNMKKKNVLSLVAGERELSAKEIPREKILPREPLEKGTIFYEETDIGWKEKLLFRLYLQEFFPSSIDVNGEHALDYELEYLVTGKVSDRQNLQGVVNRLLLVRELSNLQYLRTDISSQQTIAATAAAIATATLTPELIPAYKAGIMAAWAYAEAVSDVRLLLDGQRVQLIKTKEQWHTDVTALSQGGNTEQEKQTVGLSYQDYIQMFMWLMKDSTLASRAMNLIELNTGVNMNHQLHRLDGEIQYRGGSVFPFLIGIGEGTAKNYVFTQTFSANYITE